MFSITRSLLNQPTLRLLDEPNEGVAPKTAKELMVAVKRDGVSIMISEQARHTIGRCTDRVYVVNRGMTVSNGRVDNFHGQREITRKYLMVQ